MHRSVQGAFRFCSRWSFLACIPCSIASPRISHGRVWEQHAERVLWLRPLINMTETYSVEYFHTFRSAVLPMVEEINTCIAPLSYVLTWSAAVTLIQLLPSRSFSHLKSELSLQPPMISFLDQNQVDPAADSKGKTSFVYAPLDPESFNKVLRDNVQMKELDAATARRLCTRYTGSKIPTEIRSLTLLLQVRGSYNERSIQCGTVAIFNVGDVLPVLRRWLVRFGSVEQHKHAIIQSFTRAQTRMPLQGEHTQ